MKALMLASVASMIDQFNMDNIRLLQELGYEVQVVCNFEFGNTSSAERVASFRKELEEMQVKPIHVAIPRKISAIGDILNSYKEVKKLVEQEKYEIVHCQSPIGGVIARLACKNQRKNGTRVIYTAHGFHFFKGAPKANWMIFYPIEKYLSKYTDALITICKEDYNRGKEKMNAKQVCYTPGIGIDVERISGMKADWKKREEIGISQDDRLILSIGELNKNKNHKLVLEAMAKMKRPDVHFVVCGQGDQLEEYQQLSKQLGIEKQVHLLGFRTDAKEWLQVADIFAFPSFREGLPVSLMEAMAAGLPAVVTRIRGNVDLIEENKGGYFVEPTDVENMKECLERLLDNEGMRREMGAYNRNAVEKFSSKQVKKIMRQIYQSAKE